jgi:uncharacterized protein (TIGR02246 family)
MKRRSFVVQGLGALAVSLAAPMRLFGKARPAGASLTAHRARGMACILYALLTYPGVGHAQSASPGALADDLVKAWNAHEAAGFKRLYTEDAVWVPVAEVRDEGRDSIVEDLMVAHTSWARKTTIVLFGDVTIRRPRPGVATVFFRMKFLDRENQPIVGLERALILVAVEDSDGWRISAGQLTKESAPRK